ncbi:ubiquinone biosynthesis accessory factor UbiJ [Marinospirillum alkaliphilum]|uniref:Ubiquinone biosynthesis protein UbiJ n=1 Tax=Marinospirillum alkaliphilum DSM 21637 TaxID=1122209 RepID=A0A1K1W8J4_9GAMM|nr:SCP2 sterol-binding domain-containing protein [Marinospirillum alkaliphilum]SFX33491.1 ubiquinone biosynthesis protein UbiJ [Marinospirillum alkaliphilum DSM 21637]
MALPLSLLAGLESLINPLLRQAVAREGAAAAALQELHGSLLELRVTGLDVQVQLQVNHEGLSLYRQADVQPDAWMEASPASYLKMATRPDASAVLFSPEVQIGGDTRKLELLQDLMSGLGLDAAELIHQFTGPLPLALLQSGMSRLLGFGQRFSQSAGQDLKDYLDDETGLLPGRNSLHLLEDALGELRLDVDRLEARIRLLEQTGNKTGEH